MTQQTKVISAQLEAMQESIDLQREKEYRESEPIITCKTGQASNIQKNLILVNYGGRITELEVSNIDPQSDRKVSINPKDVLDKYSEGKLTIKGKRAPDEFKFKLSYTDKLGNRKSIKYLVPKDLFEIRQLNQ